MASSSAIARRILSIDVGIKNLAYCVLEKHREAEHATVTRWEAFRVTDAAEKSSSDRTSVAIVRALEDKDLLNVADVVVIEKQPRSNVRMRVVEGILCTYFACRGKINAQSSIENVVSYSPKRKLGAAGHALRGTRRYGDRKKTGIMLCSSLLRSAGDAACPAELRDAYFASSKKDDLADCFLQGIEYLDGGSVDAIVPDTAAEAEFHRVVARKPTPTQERRGYSLSNVKWFVSRAETPEDVRTTFDADTRFRAAVVRYFDGVDEAIRRFFPETADPAAKKKNRR